jgi:His Kinase A (phospho-acceptor) domain
LQLSQFATVKFPGFPIGHQPAIRVFNHSRRMKSLVRFDDRLSTLLAQQLPDDSAKAALWAQLVDLAAQHRGELGDQARVVLREKIDVLRESVPVHRRAQVARAVARKSIHADAVASLGRDHAHIAAPVLRVADLPATAWQEIIPALPVASRALLRERRDLPEAAMRMLSGFGVSDYALPGTSIASVEALGGTTPIGEMVARIEAFQRQRASTSLVNLHQPAALPVQAAAQNFRFETDRDGMLCWVEGVERGALIGLTIAELAAPGSFGVDGHAAGAFRQRAGFTDARLVVAGSGAAAGNWLIGGDPLFNANDGRFLGYRGIGRRPLAAEGFNAVNASPAVPEMGGDSMRQIAHELRTPLNAISGFAQMIDHQMLGPAGHPYRERARAILVDAARLSETIEGADLSAQLEAGRIARDVAAATDISDVLERVAQEIAPATEQKSVHLRLTVDRNLPRVGVTLDNCHRMISRLIVCTLDVAQHDEVIPAHAEQTPAGIVFSVKRPRHLVGVSHQALFDRDGQSVAAASSHAGLGLAFSLRLVERLAAATGGRFTSTAQDLTLILPPARDSARVIEGGS